MNTVTKKLTRAAVLATTFFLPRERRVAIERKVRGYEQVQKLRSADGVIVSFGKSGRTWLRVMLSRFYQVRHGLSERHLIGFDNLHRRNRDIPRLFFTHDNYVKDWTGNERDKSDYAGSRVVLLVRHPADVAVSQYHQWRHRMKPRKKTINDYPDHGEDVSMFDFVMGERGGLPRIVGFMNDWAAESGRLPALHVVRYEDLRARPEETLGGILDFLGTPASDAELKEAVGFASFDNMRRMEEKRTFWLSGGRMVPKDRSNPDSYKVRRGKVGGFRDYFDDEQNARIEAWVREHLSPVYGYEQPEGGGA